MDVERRRKEPGGSRVGGKEKGSQRGSPREGRGSLLYIFIGTLHQSFLLCHRHRDCLQNTQPSLQRKKNRFFSPRSQIQMTMALENLFRSPQTLCSNELALSPSFYSKGTKNVIGHHTCQIHCWEHLAGKR